MGVFSAVLTEELTQPPAIADIGLKSLERREFAGDNSGVIQPALMEGRSQPLEPHESFLGDNERGDLQLNSPPLLEAPKFLGME